MPPDAPKLGILAGAGELPRLLIQACRAAGRPFFVIALKSQCDAETAEGVEHAWVRLGQAGKAIQHLHKAGVKELVLAGRIRKPSMAQLMPDARTLKFLAGGALSAGDDSLLSAIVQTLEDGEGFRVVGVHDVMPDLLMPEGPLGAHMPEAHDQSSIRTAVHAARDLGARDIGQAAVAKDGAIVALEDRAGTDAMLDGLADNPDAHGAVLAKMLKPGQEVRVDMPAIGVDTVEFAARAGLNGIVAEAGGALAIRRDAIADAADRLGLFVVGVKP